MKLNHFDELKEGAIQLIKVLLDVKFGLQDSFCDSADLKASWEHSLMETPLTFFATLFRIPKHELFQSSTDDLEDPLLAQEAEEVDQRDAEQDQLAKNNKPGLLVITMYTTSLFIPNTCLLLHGGKQITPLCMMLGHTIYGRDHGKGLITVQDWFLCKLPDC